MLSENYNELKKYTVLYAANRDFLKIKYQEILSISFLLF